MWGLRSIVAIGIGALASCLSVPDADGSGGTSTGGTTGECPVGVEGCPCSAAQTCFAPLVCAQGVCVGPDDSTTSTTHPTTTTATTTTATTTGITSTTTDPTTSDGTQGTGTEGTDGSAGTTDGPFVHRIFVTSVTTDTQALGGTQGADMLCQTLVGQSNWVAVLRTQQETFMDRIQIVGPVERMDGLVVAGDATDFFSSTISAPIEYDEDLTLVPEDTRVWIGDDNDDCNGWIGGGQGRTVDVGEPDLLLIGSATHNCGEDNHLFCISQPEP